MKNILFITFAIIGSSFAFSQSTVGIRIGSGNSGVNFEAKVIGQTNNNIQVESEGDKIKSYVVLDENENVVQSKNINASHNASVNVNNLQSGFYYIAVISENDEVSINTYIKP